MNPPRRRCYSVLLVKDRNKFARIERRGRSTREVKEKVEEGFARLESRTGKDHPNAVRSDRLLSSSW